MDVMDVQKLLQGFVNYSLTEYFYTLYFFLLTNNTSMKLLKAIKDFFLVFLLGIDKKDPIIQQLIDYYELHIQELKSKQDVKGFDWNDYVWEHQIQFGLCNCAQIIFDRKIYNKRWVKKHCKETGYWIITPAYVNSLSKAITLLEYRLNILKSL